MFQAITVVCKCEEIVFSIFSKGNFIVPHPLLFSVKELDL